MSRARTLIVTFCSAFAPAVLPAQQPADCAKMNDIHADHATMDHAAHQTFVDRCASNGVTPTLSGQAAFGGIEADVTGDGKTTAAIRRILVSQCAPSSRTRAR